MRDNYTSVMHKSKLTCLGHGASFSLSSQQFSLSLPATLTTKQQKQRTSKGGQEGRMKRSGGRSTIGVLTIDTFIFCTEIEQLLPTVFLQDTCNERGKRMDQRLGHTSDW